MAKKEEKASPKDPAKEAEARNAKAKAEKAKEEAKEKAVADNDKAEREKRRTEAMAAEKKRRDAHEARDRAAKQPKLPAELEKAPYAKKIISVKEHKDCYTFVTDEGRKGEVAKAGKAPELKSAQQMDKERRAAEKAKKEKSAAKA